jgi:hypothetical protein
MQAGADTVTFKDGIDGYAGTQDTYLANYLGNAGYFYEVGSFNNSNSGQIAYGAIRFDITSLPAGATITSAKLGLKQFYMDSPDVVSVFELYKPWTEMGATWTQYDEGGGRILWKLLWTCPQSS